VEEERDPEGGSLLVIKDDLDRNFGRILSLERYKRNHLFIEQIFTPHTAGIYHLK
jgi:hypothetical protein